MMMGYWKISMNEQQLCSLLYPPSPSSSNLAEFHMTVFTPNLDPVKICSDQMQTVFVE